MNVKMNMLIPIQKPSNCFLFFENIKNTKKNNTKLKNKDNTQTGYSNSVNGK